MAVARSCSGGVVIRYVLPVFTDNVIFAHKPGLLDVAAQLRRSAHAALGLAIKCAEKRLQANERTGLLKLTSQVATPGAESAVYDYLVLVLITMGYFIFR